jgi:hypothetical protein
VRTTFPQFKFFWSNAAVTVPTVNVMDRFTTGYQDASRDQLINAHLDQYGVVVITDVFSLAEAHAHRDNILDALGKICPEFAANPGRSTLPAGPRPGLVQSLVNIKPVDDLRNDPRLPPLWQAGYKPERQRQGFVQSRDGINVWPPPCAGEQPTEKPWPHVDQTISHNIRECVQGQIVLNASTAAFRCTPGSHKGYEAVSRLTIDDQGKSRSELKNWNIFRDKANAVRDMLVGTNVIALEDWQIKIIAPPGSVILWLSTTIHSGSLHSGDVCDVSIDALYFNWRCVVYMCLRPRSEVTKSHLARLSKCDAENRLTNHWGSRMFPTSFWHSMPPNAPESISKYQTNPALVYADFPALVPTTKATNARITPPLKRQRTLDFSSTTNHSNTKCV